MPHRYSTRFAAMLQYKLYVLCSSVFPNLKSSRRNFKNLLNSSCFYLHFFFWKSSQPSFSVLFRKQKIDRKWYLSFFKNDSTCKLYVHNYIIISVYRDFQNMCGTQYFIFAGYPFRSPGCCSWMTYHFICAFYLSLLFIVGVTIHWIIFVRTLASLYF